jgi:RNA-binding protein
MICKAVKCEWIQAICNKIVLYKQSSNLKKRKIELPNK